MKQIVSYSLLMLLIVIQIIIIDRLQCQKHNLDDDDTLFLLKINRDKTNPNFIIATMTETKTDTIYNAVIDINGNTNWIRTNFKSIPSIKLLNAPCSTQGQTKHMKALIGNGLLIDSMCYSEITIQDDCPYQSSLALGIRTVENKGTLLIDSIKEYHINEVLCMAFSKTHPDEGTIYLGEQSGDLYNSKEWTFTCSSSASSKWNCPLEGIIIGDIYLDQKPFGTSIGYIKLNDPMFYKVRSSSVILETIHRFIIVPYVFFNHLINFLFKKHLEDKKCVINREGIVLYLSCSNEVIHSLPNISFMINQSLITFSNDILFETINDNEMRYLIITKSSSEKDDEKKKDEWVFGNILLNVFDITIEYDSRTVHLHKRKGNLERIKIIQEHDDSKETTNNKLNIIEIMLIIITIFGIIGTLYILLALFYLQKSIKQ